MSEVKRFLGFSAMEWSIILLGGGGMVAMWLSFPATWWKIFSAGAGLSFLFEASMAPLFTYDRQLRERHCIQNTDVNFLFPLGWMSMAGWSAFLAEKVLPFPLFVNYLLGSLLIGNLQEFLFHHFKFWVYNYDASMIGTFKPLQPKLPIGGIPLQVIAGYVNVGIMVYFLTRILF